MEFRTGELQKRLVWGADISLRLIAGRSLQNGPIGGPIVSYNYFAMTPENTPITLPDDSSLETILALVKQLETTALGLKQLRGFVGKGLGSEMLELLIEETETTLAEIKRKLIQQR